jgi:hypothetical protein
MEEDWTRIKDTVIDTAKQVIGASQTRNGQRKMDFREHLGCDR